jgi:hypothetical protein
VTVNQAIYLPDINKNLNKWIIENETENTYKIYADYDKRFVTEVYKSLTYWFEGKLYSSEIRSPFSTIVPDRYGKCEYCWIVLDY